MMSRRALVDWAAQLASLVIESVFLLILCLAITNEDKPQGPAVVVLVSCHIFQMKASRR